MSIARLTYADHIPSFEPDARAPVLRRPNPKRPRLPRHGSLVRRQQVGGHHTTGCRRRHTSRARFTGNEHGVQGRRRVRFLDHL